MNKKKYKGKRDGMKKNAEKIFAEFSPEGRYARTNTILGKGSYKIVYNALDNKKGIDVAWNRVNIKFLNPKEKKRIRNEVALLDKMSHPHIINLSGAWYKDENVYFDGDISFKPYKGFITAYYFFCLRFFHSKNFNNCFFSFFFILYFIWF